MKYRDIEHLASMRFQQLNKDAFSELGIMFLKKIYFPLFYYSKEGFVLVSENDKGIINGFVAGSFNFSKQLMFLNFKLFINHFFVFVLNPLKYPLFIFGTLKPKKNQYNLEGHGKLSSMVVTEEAKGKGIGTLLTQKLLHKLRLKGVMKCYLYCREENLAAKNLYIKNGFIVKQKFKTNLGHWNLMICQQK